MRYFYPIMFVCALFILIPTYASAETANEMSTKEIDNILINEVEVPKEILNNMEDYYKRELVDSYFDSEKSMKFDRETKTDYYYDANGNLVQIKDNGDISTMGVIPKSQLSLYFQVFDMSNSTNGSFKRFYANFEWKVDKVSIRNDRMGISLPSGWQIISGSANCYVTKYALGKWLSDGNCGGRTMSSSIYGYSWDIGYGTTTGVAYLRGGHVRLDAKKTSSSAPNRAVGEYAHDTTSKRNSSISVGWGPVSVTHSATTGSIDTAGLDW